MPITLTKSVINHPQWKKINLTHWQNRKAQDFLPIIDGQGVKITSTNPAVSVYDLAGRKVAVREYEPYLNAKPAEVFNALQRLLKMSSAVTEVPIALIEYPSCNRAQIVTLWRRGRLFKEFLDDKTIPFEHKLSAAGYLVKNLARLNANGITINRVLLRNAVVDYRPKLGIIKAWPVDISQAAIDEKVSQRPDYVYSNRDAYEVLNLMGSVSRRKPVDSLVSQTDIDRTIWDTYKKSFNTWMKRLA